MNCEQTLGAWQGWKINLAVKAAVNLERLVPGMRRIFGESPFPGQQLCGILQGRATPLGGASHEVHLPVEKKKPTPKDRIIKPGQQFLILEESRRDFLPLGRVQRIRAFQRGPVSVQRDRFSRLPFLVVKARVVTIDPGFEMDGVARLSGFDGLGDGWNVLANIIIGGLDRGHHRQEPEEKMFPFPERSGPRTGSGKWIPARLHAGGLAEAAAW